MTLMDGYQSNERNLFIAKKMVSLAMGNTCDFEKIIKIAPAQLESLEQVGAQYPNGESQEACLAFSKEVKEVEGFVIYIYKYAVSSAKKEKGLREIVAIWRDAEKFCSIALKVVSKLKSKYRHCGTAELYDLILDYKLECKKRFNNASEEMECHKKAPTGLFPENI